MMPVISLGARQRTIAAAVKIVVVIIIRAGKRPVASTGKPWFVVVIRPRERSVTVEMIVPAHISAWKRHRPVAVIRIKTSGIDKLVLKFRIIFKRPVNFHVFGRRSHKYPGEKQIGVKGTGRGQLVKSLPDYFFPGFRFHRGG
jgi:hypothetical protein